MARDDAEGARLYDCQPCGMTGRRTNRYLSDFEAGMNAVDIALKHGVSHYTVRSWAKTHGLKFGEPRNPPIPHNGPVDNALTAAFREVFGWCPFRDSRGDNKKPTPKTIVDPDPIDRRCLP